MTGMIEGYSGICLGGKIWQVFFGGVGGGVLVGIFWGIQIFWVFIFVLEYSGGMMNKQTQTFNF